MHLSPRGALGYAAAVVALAAGSTVAVAAASGGLGGSDPGRTGSFRFGGWADSAACQVPSLPGTTVQVTLTDMGPGMMGGGMGGLRGPADGDDGGSGTAPWGIPGRMSVQVSPSTVPAGTVSLAVADAGRLTHELVVLPLPAGARPGQRTVGPDGTVSEDGSLGEASASCAAGAGDGIAAGSAGWVTLTLAPGRYELVCNLPGHYAAGMYAELDVTA